MSLDTSVPLIVPPPNGNDPTAVWAYEQFQKIANEMEILTQDLEKIRVAIVALGGSIP